MKNTIRLSAIIATALASAQGTFATAILTLDDGINPAVTVIDGNADGMVVFNGSYGSWIVNVTTGITKPTLGTAANPQGDLNSVNVSGGVGTLKISFSDNNYTGQGVMSHTLGGTTSGSIDYSVYLDVGNTELATPPAGLLFNFLDNGGSFSIDTDSGALPGGNYALTQVLIIKHGEGVNITSGDFRYFMAPDGGSTALTLGIGLLGMVGFRRFRA